MNAYTRRFAPQPVEEKKEQHGNREEDPKPNQPSEYIPPEPPEEEPED